MTELSQSVRGWVRIPLSGGRPRGQPGRRRRPSSAVSCAVILAAWLCSSGPSGLSSACISYGGTAAAKPHCAAGPRRRRSSSGPPRRRASRSRPVHRPVLLRRRGAAGERAATPGRPHAVPPGGQVGRAGVHGGVQDHRLPRRPAQGVGAGRQTCRDAPSSTTWSLLPTLSVLAYPRRPARQRAARDRWRPARLQRQPRRRVQPGPAGLPQPLRLYRDRAGRTSLDLDIDPRRLGSAWLGSGSS
jgi:hypothetical protein